MHAMGHEGDMVILMEAPMMAQANPSFEDNADSDAPLAPWGTWPPENTNFAFETEGMEYLDPIKPLWFMMECIA